MKTFPKFSILKTAHFKNLLFQLLKSNALQKVSITSPAYGVYRQKNSLRTLTTDSHEKSFSLIGRDFLTLQHFSQAELKNLLWTALDLKTRFQNGEGYRPLNGKTLALLFEKRSIITQLSAETGMALLGGRVISVREDESTGGMTESARVLSVMVDCVIRSVHNQSDLEHLAAEASIPVINGCSNSHHPLQTLADLLTLQEHFGYLRGLKLAWVGVGNSNVNSLMLGATKLGMDLSIATPKGYECDPQVIQHTLKISSKNNTELRFTYSPEEAVREADVILTGSLDNVQNSTHQYSTDFRVTNKLCSRANSHWVFLHGLPRKKEEVTDDVFYDPQRSLVWQQAENRKWTLMAVLLHLMVDHTPTIEMPKYGRLS